MTESEVLPDGGTIREYQQLFASVVVLFVVGAALDESPGAALLQTVVAGLALMLSLRVGPAKQRTQRIVGALVVLAIAAAALALLRTDESTPAGLTLLVNGLLVAGGPIAVFGAVRRHTVVSMRTVLGAITIYVMVGLFFATLYRSLYRFDIESFTAANGVIDPATLQYLSIITLTTVGFGDVVAVTGLARTMVALEALIGQIYLVTIVALVVSNLGRIRERRIPKG
jgi:Ion channel